MSNTSLNQQAYKSHTFLHILIMLLEFKSANICHCPSRFAKIFRKYLHTGSQIMSGKYNAHAHLNTGLCNVILCKILDLNLVAVTRG